MACSREASAAAWPALGPGPGWRRYFRSSDSSAAIAVAACSYAVAVRTARALVPAALLVTREPIVTTTMSAISPALAPVIAHRFHEPEMGLRLTVDRVIRCPDGAEVENHIQRSTFDLANPLLRQRRRRVDSHRRRGPSRPVDGRLPSPRPRRYCRTTGGGRGWIQRPQLCRQRVLVRRRAKDVGGLQAFLPSCRCRRHR